jgi:prevent-host-death family protein
MAIIRPVRELRNNYVEISILAHETSQPIHITNNGRGDTVLMSEAAFERLCSKAYIDFKLLESELKSVPSTDARASLSKMREKVVGYLEQV